MFKREHSRTKVSQDG